MKELKRWFPIILFVVIFGTVGIMGWLENKAHAQAEAPVVKLERSLQVIDSFGSLDVSKVTLMKIEGCHYIFIDGNHPILMHLDTTCPNPVHRRVK